MALPKKGWKNITVADDVYAWSIKHETPRLHVQVSLPDGSGRRLYAHFDEERVITPRVVRFLIESSLGNGWQPTDSGVPLKIDGDTMVAGTETEMNHPPDCNWPH